MNLRWKAFEKSLRARVKYHDARRKMTLWQRIVLHFSVPRRTPTLSVPDWLFRVIRATPSICLLVVALLQFADFGSLTAHPNAVMNAIGIWGIFAALLRADTLRAAAAGGAKNVMWMLPLTTDRIFDHLLGRIAFDLVCLLFEFLCAYGIVALTYHQPLAGFAVCLACAISQVALSFAITLTLLRLKGKAQLPIFPAFMLAIIYALASAMTFKETPLHLMKLGLFDLFNPMGWINAAYLHGWIGGNSQAWWFLAPTLALLATLPSSFRAFRRMHRNREFPSMRVVDGRIVIESEQTAPPPTPDPAALRRQILSADILQPMPWNERGPLERLLALILRPGEIAIAKALVISPPAWPKKFFQFAFCLLCIWGLNILVDFHSMPELVVRSPGKAMARMLLSLAIFTFTIRYAATLFSWPTAPSPRLCMLPLRPFELWKIKAKVNGLTLALILPLSFLVPFSPFGLPAGERGGPGPDFFTRVITLIACCAFTGFWSFEIHRFGVLKPWQSQSVLFLVNFGLPLVGFTWVLSLEGTPSLALAPLFIVVPLVWSYLCGMLELKAWRIAASRSAAHS